MHLDAGPRRCPAGGDRVRYFRCLAALTRWAETEERHYAIPDLRWSATFFAEQGRPADVAACADGLARIAAETGNPEALAALSHALGEAALLDVDAAQAADPRSRALEVLRPIDVPFERAQIRVRAGVALAAVGEREAAVEQLTEAYRTANRLEARPLAAEAVRQLEILGEQVECRLGRRAAGQRERAGLTRRELEVVRLVAVGARTGKWTGVVPERPHRRDARQQYPHQAGLPHPDRGHAQGRATRLAQPSLDPGSPTPAWSERRKRQPMLDRSGAQ